MWLKIINIKTDKEKYIFWEDKEIKLSFDITSDNKDYNLNSVFVNHWIEIYKNLTKRKENLEKINIADYTTIRYLNNQSFTCIIPIKIPNKWKEYDIEEIEIKNIFEINADIKLNPFDCKEKYYPNIEIINIIDEKTEIIDKETEIINKEIENLITITDEINYDKIKKEIYTELSIFKTDNMKDIDFEKINILIEEQKKYFTIKNQQKYNKLQDQLLGKEWKLIDDISYSKYDIEKDNPNYVNIGNLFNIDYINKDYYNYLLQKYKLFRLYIFLNNKNIFIPISVIIFIICILLFLFSNLNIQKISIFLIIFITIFLISIYQLKNYTITNIKRKLINIKINDKNNIIQSFNNRTLKFNDIFQDLNINYNWIYKCYFDVVLNCVLKIQLQEWDLNNKRIEEYEKNIFELKIADYIWNNLNMNNIKSYNQIQKLQKFFIQPWLLSPTTKWFILETNNNNNKIVYKIKYNLESNDLIDMSWEIII